MSVRAVTWALDQDLAPTPKLILVTLADWADEDDYCFPGHDRILARVSVSRRTLVSILQKLEAEGYFKRERRTRDGGSRTSDGYWLCTTVGLQCAKSARATDDIPNVQTVAHTRALRNEPPVNQPGVNGRASEDPDFREFYARYPRKVGRPAALRAWRAARNRGDASETILAGLQKHLPDLASREVRLVPHPSTWLNQERYNDEPEVPGERLDTRTRAEGSSTMRKPNPDERFAQTMNIQPINRGNDNELR